MNDKERNDLVKELLDKIEFTSGSEMCDFFGDLQSRMIQIALDAEINNHVKNIDPKDNKKNGHSSKNREIKTKNGVVKVDTPRDRKGTFEPIIVKKNQKVIDDFSDLAILLYSKGNSLDDIKEIIKNLYKIDLSKEYLSDLISTIKVDVTNWQTRLLKPIYPIMFVDCMYIPVIKNGTSQKIAVYVILGISLEGKKEVVGTWIGDGNESSSFWLSIFDELKKRGVEDIIHIAMDGLTGLKDAISEEYPLAKTQRCVVHLIRNLYKFLPKKAAKNIISDFKKIYQSSTLELAELEYNNFKEKYKDNIKLLNKIETMMIHIYPLFDETLEIRKMIYTTNAIESVNSCLRKLTNSKGAFRNEASVLQVLYLRIIDLEKKWSTGVKGWNVILNQLCLTYEDRVTKYIVK